MSELHLLYRLQQFDTDIRLQKGQLGAVLKAQKGNEKFNVAVEAHKNAQTLAAEKQAEQRTLAADIAALVAKTEESETKLYSGKVKNPKELAELQLEVNSLKKRQELFEERMLLIVSDLEKLQLEELSCSDELAAISMEWEDELKRLQAEQNKLAHQINYLLAGRKEHLGLISAMGLKQYHNLSKRKKGVAVAALKGNLCQGCGVSVSANLVKLAEVGQFAYCTSCGRLLSPV